LSFCTVFNLSTKTYKKPEKSEKLQIKTLLFHQILQLSIVERKLCSEREMRISWEVQIAALKFFLVLKKNFQILENFSHTPLRVNEKRERFLSLTQ
jgi:hypothetical protein